MKKILMSFLVCVLISLSLIPTSFAGETYTIPAKDRLPTTTSEYSAEGNGLLVMYAGQAAGFGINFEISPTNLTVVVATDTRNSGEMEVRLDSMSGPLIGSVDLKTVVGTWDEYPVKFPITMDISGQHSIWVCMKGRQNLISVSFTVPDADDLYYSFEETDVFPDITGDPQRVKINLLSQLGILKGSSEKPFDKESLIVKRDLVRAVAGFFPDSVNIMSGDLFSDITTEDADYLAFAKLCSVGVLKADPKKNFNPFSKVSLDYACSLCVDALNFNHILKKGKDTYQTAREVGLLSGVKPDGYLKRKDMVTLLYNMLSADYAKLSGIENGKYIYASERYLLQQTRDIYYEVGVVSANQNYDIYFNSSRAQFGNVYIGDKTYEIGKTNAANYVGMKCRYFYEENNGYRKLIAIYPYSDTMYTLINSNDTDILNVSDSEITCFEDDEEKEYCVSGNVIIMYNGRVASGNLSSMIDADTFVGKILMIDNDNDSNADVLFIEAPKTIIFGGLGKNSVYDDITKTHITFDDIDDVFLNLGEWSGVKQGDIIEYYQSNNITGDVLTRFYVSYEKAEGIITGLDGNGKITLDDGSSYYPDPAFAGNIEVGSYAELSLTSYDRYVTVKSSPSLVGVMFSHSRLTNNTLDEDYAIKILTEAGIEIIETAKKVTADGVKCEKVSELINGKGSFAGLTNIANVTAVRYELNSAGKIVMLDFPDTYSGARNTFDTLTELQPVADYRYVDSYLATGNNPRFTPIQPVSNDVKTAHLYFENLNVNANPKVFDLHEDETLHSFGAEPESAKTGTRTLAAYSTESGKMHADFLMYYRMGGVGGDSRFDTPFVYQSSKIALNKQGEKTVVIKGTTGAKTVEYTVHADKYNTNAKDDLRNPNGDSSNNAGLKDTIDVLKKGDVLLVSVDIYGDVCLAKVERFVDGAKIRRTSDGVDVEARLFDDGGINISSTAWWSESDNRSAAFIGEVVAVENGTLKVKVPVVTDGVRSFEYRFVRVGALSNMALCDVTNGITTVSGGAGAKDISVGTVIYAMDELHIWLKPEFIAIFK